MSDLVGVEIIDGPFFAHDKHGEAKNLEIINTLADFKDYSFNAPSLNTIGRTMFSTGWVGSAPKLKSVNGREYWWAGKIEL